MPDAKFDFVTALLSADPLANVYAPTDSTYVLDRAGATWGIGGDITLSSTWKKFGDLSIRVQSRGYAYRTDNRIAAVGSSPFCIEGWLNADATQPDDYPIVFNSYQNSSFNWGDGAFGVYCDYAVHAPNKLALFSYNANGLGSDGLLLASTTNPKTAGPLHFAFTRDGDTWRLFINGVQESTTTWSGSLNSASQTQWVSIGGSTKNYESTGFNGYIDDFRITIGDPRYTANFTPPTAAFEYERAARKTNTLAVRSGQIGTIPAQPTARKAGGVRVRRDVHWTGDGLITGTVKQKATPSNIALRRRVLLLDETTNMIMRETWSDAATGDYSFDYIDRSRRYTVVSYDYTQNYRAVIADNLVPEVRA